MMARIVLCTLLVPMGTMADSVAPSSVNATLNVGANTTINKTVTVTAGTPTTSKVDVYFLADTTGSMGGEIAAVKASASSILSSTAGLGDVQFAVGEYKDIGDSYQYRLNTGMTANQSTAQNAINMWGASGGGDDYESQLQALYFAATQSATGWRSGSAKILVWFGDYPGHDPAGSAAITEATATASLVAGHIKVEAIDVGILNGIGQASRIAAATGGTFYSGIDSSSIVATIQAAIISAFTNYSTASLDLSGVPAGLAASVVPANYTGTFDRSVNRTFDFAVTLQGVSPGTYSFSIPALVDGGIVATESDTIQVNDTTQPPVVVCRSSITLSNDTGLCSATVTGAELDNGSYSPTGGPLTFTLAPPPPYPLGSNWVTFTATDTNGLSTSVTNVLIIVVDAEPPGIICASNKVVECGTAWDFDPPLAFDNCSATNVFINVVSTVTNAGCGGTFTATRTWVATDWATNTATCSQTVVVVDTTPPTVVCPASLAVEFQDENGAVVPCTINVSNDCSPVSLVVTPPCGSVFPIGVTPVQATATDACSNSASCSFTVTVLGAQGVKSNVLVELIILRDQATQQQNGNDVIWWNTSIADLIISLQTNRWLDQTHVVCGKLGAEVFDSEKNVVICLTNLIDWGGSGIPGPTLQDLVDRLVRADRLLAVLSIQEAVLAGVSPVIISNALVYVARGDEAAIGSQASGPDPASAIMWYKKAWALTCRVCPPVVTPLAGGKVKIQFNGVPGVTYQIQASTDMVNWTTLRTITVGSSGLGSYTFRPRCPEFYRVVPQL
jgi:hypothetical protein